MSERGEIPYLKTVGHRESPKLLKEPIQDTSMFNSWHKLQLDVKSANTIRVKVSKAMIAVVNKACYVFITTNKSLKGTNWYKEQGQNNNVRH